MCRPSLTEELPGRMLAKPKRRVPTLAMTVAETAEALGLSSRTVADLLRGGELPGVRIGSRWIVPVDAVRRRLDELADDAKGDAV